MSRDGCHVNWSATRQDPYRSAMRRIDEFSVDDLVEASAQVRATNQGATSMEEVAGRIVRQLRDDLVGPDGTPALGLARFYKTHPFAKLDPDLQAFARDAAAGELAPDVSCLTLLATAGAEADWNDRRRSRGHQAIPLTSVAAVRESPMIAQLITDLGDDIAEVVHPDPRLNIQRHHRDYNVFYVPEVRGSGAVPAQREFVEPYGIRSALGLGGVLPSGDMFAVVLFSTVTIPETTADLFRSLALSVKAAVVPFTFKVFGDGRDASALDRPLAGRDAEAEASGDR